MTQSRTRNSIPRSSGPSAPAVPTWSFLLGRAFVGFLREVRRTGWSSAIGRLARSRHQRLVLEAAPWLAKSRRAPSRTFQPTVDGRLEVRMMLSGGTSAGTRFVEASRYLLKHPSARAAYNLKQPQFLALHAPHFNNVHGFRVKTRHRDPDGAGWSGRRGDRPGWLPLHDQAFVHLEYHRDQHRGGNERTARGHDGHGAPPHSSPSRTPIIRSRSGPSGPTPCRAAAWGSSWTARPPIPI